MPANNNNRCQSKRFPISSVVPGMQISKMILSGDGKILLEEGTVLTASLIDRLKFWGISFVDIREQAAAPASALIYFDLPEPEARDEFRKGYQSTVAVLNQSFDAVRYSNEVQIKQMRELADESIDQLVTATGVISHLHMVHRPDDYTFHHSVNVSVISGLLGKWAGYTGENLKDLILAGLLHDIGKAQVPLEILNKPVGLSPEEMELMQSHASSGFQLLKKTGHVSNGVMLGVLQHHERMDGSGYPLGVAGEKIHPYARIIAVADIYDAVTSDRVYRRRETPFAVAEMLIGEMFNKLDPAICTTFLNNIRDYFVGNIVRLSDGREAKVVYLGKFMGARPVVQAENGEFIDLETCKEISIKELVAM